VNRLFLVRHGENRANLTREFSHRLVDYPLTPKGRLQAAQTAAFLRQYPVSQVFTSPLKRARETAQVIAEATGAPLSVLEGFREVNVGRLEKEPPNAANWRLHDEIIRAWWTGEAHARFPGGETYVELVQRVRRGYETVLKGRDGETLVVVAHGGSLALPLLSLASNLDREALRAAAHHNCAVSELEGRVHDGKLHLGLVHWAMCEHLSGEAAAFVAGTPAPKDLADI